MADKKNQPAPGRGSLWEDLKPVGPDPLAGRQLRGYEERKADDRFEERRRQRHAAHENRISSGAFAKRVK